MNWRTKLFQLPLVRYFWYLSIEWNSEQDARKAIRLYRLITIVLLLTFTYSAAWLLFLPDLAYRQLYAIPVVGLMLIIQALIRRRKLRFAINFFFVTIWFLVTLITVTAGGTLAPFAIVYTLAVMTTVIFAEWRMATIMGIVSLLSGFVMVLLANANMIPKPIATPFSAWLTQVLVMGLITADAYILTSDLQREIVKGKFELAERVKAEEALRESEARFRLLSSVTSDYVFRSQIDAQGNPYTLWVSGAFEPITGYTPDEFVALGGWSRTLHPDDVEKDRHDMEALNRNQPVVSEVRIIHKNGGVRWVRVYAVPLWDSQANCLVGVNGGVQDITERKVAEESLKRQEALLRALLDATTDVAFLMARDGTFLTINKTFASSLSAPPEALIGKNGFDLLNPTVSQDRRAHFDVVLQTKQPERWADDSLGEWWDNSLYPVLSANGEVEAFALYSRNFTEEMKLRMELQRYTTELERMVESRTSELRQAKEQIETILNHTSDALAFADAKGDIQVTNPAFMQTFDHGKLQSLEHILRNVANAEHMDTVSFALIKVFFDNEQQRVEARIHDGSGGARDVDLALIPVRVANDISKNGVLLSGRDITHFKEVERFKARFVADAVHDLATPIAGLSSRVYLLKRNPERLNENLVALENQVRHLKNLLEDLRILSQFDREQFELTLSACQVNDVVRRVFDTYEPVASDKKQTLSLKVTNDLPALQLDERQFERVVVNIVSNAVTYTPENKDIHIQTLREGNQVVLQVSDQGIGIPSEDLPLIFDRFYRSDEARLKNSGGTGLGLAIVKEIVEMHGGTIMVESHVGEGTTFTIRLPI